MQKVAEIKNIPYFLTVVYIQRFQKWDFHMCCCHGEPEEKSEICLRDIQMTKHINTCKIFILN